MLLATKNSIFLLPKMAKEKGFTNHLCTVKDHHYWNRSNFKVDFSFCEGGGQLSDRQKNISLNFIMQPYGKK